MKIVFFVIYDPTILVIFFKKSVTNTTLNFFIMPPFLKNLILSIISYHLE